MQAQRSLQPIREYLNETLPSLAPWNDDLKTVAGMNLESIGKCLDDIMPYFKSWMENIEVLQGVSLRSIGRCLEIILPFIVSWIDKLERYEGIPLMSIATCLRVLLPYFGYEIDRLELVKVLTTLTGAVVCSLALIGCVKLGIEALGFRSEGITPGSIAAWAQSTFYGGRVNSGSLFSNMQSVGAVGLAPSTRRNIAVASGIGSAVCLLASVASTSSNGSKKVEPRNSKRAYATSASTSAMLPFHGGSSGTPGTVYRNVRSFGEVSGLDPETCTKIAVASEIGFALGNLLSNLMPSDDEDDKSSDDEDNKSTVYESSDDEDD